MGTAGDIEQPALEQYEAVGSSQVFFEIVKYFTYTKRRGPGNDRCWEGYLKNNKRLKVSWMPITTAECHTRYVDPLEIISMSTDSLLDFTVYIPPVHNDNAKVRAKYNSSDMSMVNKPLRTAVFEKISVFKPEGWAHSIEPIVEKIEKKRRFIYVLALIYILIRYICS